MAIILDFDIFSDYASLLGWLQILSTKLNQVFQITMNNVHSYLEDLNISPAQLSTFLTSSMPTLVNMYSTTPPILAQPLLKTLILLSQHESLTMFSASSPPAWPTLCFPFVLHNPTNLSSACSAVMILPCLPRLWKCPQCSFSLYIQLYPVLKNSTNLISAKYLPGPTIQQLHQNFNKVTGLVPVQFVRSFNF